MKLENKNYVLKPRGPVRGSFTPSGAWRALDLAEVSLPLGRSLWGLLVLLISNHDRSASVQPELLSFLFFYLPLPFPLMLFFFLSLLLLTFCPSYLAPLRPISSPLFYPFLYPSLAIFSPPPPPLLLSLCRFCCLIEGELRGRCSWRGPPCLVITSLFITGANGPRGEGNNNKLIEYELQLNRNLQHFIPSHPALWLMKRCSD